MTVLKVMPGQAIADEIVTQPEQPGATLDGLGKLLDRQYVGVAGLLVLVMNLSKSPGMTPAGMGLAITVAITAAMKD